MVGIDITYTANSSYYFGYGFGGTQEAQASGSGVILTQDGYIATCAHVIAQANTIKVTLNNDETYDAKLMAPTAATISPSSKSKLPALPLQSWVKAICLPWVKM